MYEKKKTTKRMYVCMGHTALQQKVMEHCKSTILQQNIKKKKNNPQTQWNIIQSWARRKSCQLQQYVWNLKVLC